MEIHKDLQYNQGIGKYKVLSSNTSIGGKHFILSYTLIVL